MKAKAKDRLPWLERELKRLYRPAPAGVRFSVQVWCGDPDAPEPPYGWVTVARHVGQWALRRVLRHLYGRSWNVSSICVNREDDG